MGGGSEAGEAGDGCMPTADSCWCREAKTVLQSNYPPIKINTLETNKMPTWKLVSLTDAQKLASPSLLSKDTLSGPANKNEPIGNNSHVI